MSERGAARGPLSPAHGTDPTYPVGKVLLLVHNTPLGHCLSEAPGEQSMRWAFITDKYPCPLYVLALNTL